MKIDYAITTIDRVGDRRTKLSTREICYLRVTSNEKEFGYSELAPLSSWGHPSIPELLFKRNSELFDCVIELAIADLAAKEKKGSLVSKSDHLKNHVLFDLSSDSKTNLSTLLKVKIGQNIDLETTQLSSLLREELGVRVRLDFNGYFNFAEEFFVWWKKIDFKERIDFIEDPVFSDKEWQLIKELAPDVHLAADQMLGKVETKIAVVKPSWQRPEIALKYLDRENTKVVVTHVLGSELDQAQSIAEALRIRDLGWNLSECGLLATRSQFEQINGVIIANQSGFGYGVDLSSKDLVWQPL